MHETIANTKKMTFNERLKNIRKLEAGKSLTNGVDATKESYKKTKVFARY